MVGRACLVLGLVLAASTARADTATSTTNRFALQLGGVPYGLVNATTTPSAQQLLVTTADIASPLVSLVGTFAQGKPVKRNLSLASGAVVRRANDARLTSVKLPAMGGGGTADIELVFVAPTVTTQPLLSAKVAPPLPATARITGFRIDVSGLKPIEAPKLDGIALTQRSDGTVTAGDIVFEAAAGGAPPFTAWQKANGARPVPRTVRVEYFGGDGKAVVELQLDRCVMASLTPLGANGTTRITLTCAGVHAS